MSSEAISTGSIVFVGPTHESPLEGFMYLLVTKVKGTSAIVRKTGPDATDSCPERPPDRIRPRAGTSIDQWACGLVTGYYMRNGKVKIHLRHESQALYIKLTSLSTVIAVDRFNYALRTGVTVNATVLNALELLDRQSEVIVACGKSRTGIPVHVTSSLLSFPF
ncbi:hypothetical protein PPTG_12525 [Phytophthora nicotianae INRA-310]|uniref:Uncharacterized protein n=2 Tax=Phytophthora nicotianae TaxID=4792 RepID=W2Q487_PHYN3|nr:hypothetical protein PPTG_12525 [Phytophthora nicotianae INRA-310]ETI44440.1 hypothetical protein F443_10860 [Phytophthora nicotianae P1569]ETN08008.1 hypothetical protein PPTG_12525 [Phytophthora nicotianae INRA-310]